MKDLAGKDPRLAVGKGGPAGAPDGKKGSAMLTRL